MGYKELARQETIEEFVLRAIGNSKLTFPTISEVSGLSNLDVAKLAVLYYSAREQGTSSSESDDQPETTSEGSRSIKFLDQPVNQVKIPMAESTKRTLRRFDEAIRKLRE